MKNPHNLLNLREFKKIILWTLRKNFENFVLQNQNFLFKISGFFSYKCKINSPKSVLAQANQLLEKSFGLFTSKDSWIKPVPACVFFKVFRQQKISSSSSVVKACIIKPRGQILFSPTWGPPIPFANFPSLNHGLLLLKENFRVFL